MIDQSHNLSCNQADITVVYSQISNNISDQTEIT